MTQSTVPSSVLLHRLSAVAARKREAEAAALNGRIRELENALCALVDNHDYSYLDRGIGTETPAGIRWLTARRLVDGPPNPAGDAP